MGYDNSQYVSKPLRPQCLYVRLIDYVIRHYKRYINFHPGHITMPYFSNAHPCGSSEMLPSPLVWMDALVLYSRHMTHLAASAAEDLVWFGSSER